jgi:hypothetical protein
MTNNDLICALYTDKTDATATEIVNRIIAGKQTAKNLSKMGKGWAPDVKNIYDQVKLLSDALDRFNGVM